VTLRVINATASIMVVALLSLFTLSNVGVCLDSNGAIQGYYSGSADKNALEPDETTTFSTTFYGTGPCDHYLVSTNGFAE
jgi:ABC-type microcin C transport system permease subunit YejE